MQEQEFINKKYYIIEKKILWMGIAVATMIIVLLWYMLYFYTQIIDIEKYKTGFGAMESELENIDECYLCGNADKSMMGYYRKFDTIGIIGLNEWYVLDLRLKTYDEQGNETKESDLLSMTSGITQGVKFQIESVSSRGMSRATVSSEEKFDPETIKNNLCQKCLNKVVATLQSEHHEDDKESYDPFVLVDFKTLEIYSLQKNHTGISIRDYWVEIEYEGEKTKVSCFEVSGY